MRRHPRSRPGCNRPYSRTPKPLDEKRHEDKRADDARELGDPVRKRVCDQLALLAQVYSPRGQLGFMLVHSGSIEATKNENTTGRASSGAILVSSARDEGRGLGIRHIVRGYARRIVGLPSGPIEPLLVVESVLPGLAERISDCSDGLYVAFEDVFYDPDRVRPMMERYLPLLKERAALGQVVDIGAGRGEFLEHDAGGGDRCGRL